MKASPGRHGGCMLSMQWPKGIRQPGPYRQRRQAPRLQLRAVLAAHSTEICTPAPTLAAGGYGPLWLHTAQKHAPLPLRWRLKVQTAGATYSTETHTPVPTLAAAGTARWGCAHPQISLSLRRQGKRKNHIRPLTSLYSSVMII